MKYEAETNIWSGSCANMSTTFCWHEDKKKSYQKQNKYFCNWTNLKLSLDLVYSHLRRSVAVVAYLRGVSQGIHSERLKLKLTQTCVTHMFVTGSCITDGRPWPIVQLRQWCLLEGAKISNKMDCRKNKQGSEGCLKGRNSERKALQTDKAKCT